MLILVLAANTSFADFPRLSYFLARDRFMPRQFANRGDRLVFSNGILILGGTAAVLLVLFGGDTHALIPLYAVGVFISFTLSQAAWCGAGWRAARPGWWWRWWLNAVGRGDHGRRHAGDRRHQVHSTARGSSSLLIPVLVDGVHGACTATTRRWPSSSRWTAAPGRRRSSTPCSSWSATCTGASSRRSSTRGRCRRRRKAVYVETGSGARRSASRRSGASGACGVPLVVLTSPYRSLLEPVARLPRRTCSRAATTTWSRSSCPEFIPARWWQHLLHNQTALLIKGALLFSKNVIVTDVPYHLTR